MWEDMKNWQITGFLAFLIIGFVLLSGCTDTGSLNAQPAQATTQPIILNLTGTWNTVSEGSFMYKSTDYKDEYNTLHGQLFITKQQGKFLYGTFTVPMRNDTKFIGVISTDNKSAYFADKDGFIDCQIVNNDQINMVYRQVTDNKTEVISGTWTRVKVSP
jgi:hypothetical protein